MTVLRKPLARIALAVVGLAVYLAACSALMLALFPRGESPISDPIDFVAFDCAGRVAVAADPYRAEPLRSCERDVLAESGVTIERNLVVPAPLPPYALTVFRPLASLPFRDASALWLSLALASMCVSIAILRRITDAPLVAVAFCTIAAVGVGSLLDGQIVPLVFCSLCAAALALRNDRPSIAAALCLPLMLEPHVGVAAVVSLFVWEPRARLTLAVGIAALAAISLSSGIERNVEYLRVVLPAHAIAEGLAFGGQYSLSAVLALAGVGAATALAIGTASTVVLVGLSIALVDRLRAVTRVRGVSILAPVAFSVVGGAYVHVHQIAFALPLALVLYGTLPRFRRAAALGLALIAVPWETFGETVGIGPSHPRPSVSIVRRDLARVSDGDLLAETVWGVWARSGFTDSRTTAEHFAFKVPVWTGLGCIVVVALLGAFPKRVPIRRIVPSA